MTEVKVMPAIDPLPEAHFDLKICCCYVNSTNKIQIARITDVPNWYFERVVFPGQHLIFESFEGAHLEIHSGMMASAILSDIIPCIQLRLEESTPVLPTWIPMKIVSKSEPIAKL
jgi:Domain of unknown function (DUF1830)